jgi:hypothetical protein
MTTAFVPRQPAAPRGGNGDRHEAHADHWHVQDMFAIRADGPELISDKFTTETIFACG